MTLAEELEQYLAPVAMFTAADAEAAGLPADTADPANAEKPRRLVARVVPFGKVIEHHGRRVQFDPGSLTVPEGQVTPLTVDHGDGVMERIGKLVGYYETADAGYASFDISDTALAGDVVTLLEDGVLTDVSVGIMVDSERSAHDAATGVDHRAGTVDHVSIVARASFAPESSVLSLHKKGSPMAKPTSDPAPDPVAVEAYDDSKLKAEITRLSGELDKLAETRVVSEPELFTNLKDYLLTYHRAGRGDAAAMETMQKHVAQLVAAERYALDTADTTDAAGLVPDFLSSKIISLIDGDRPTVEAFDKEDAGTTGMSVVLPKVTVKPTVDTQAAEFTEPESTAMDIANVSFDLETYAGAGRVSVQLIERSQPSYVDRLIAELAGAYATKTDAAFNAALVAGVGTNTAIVADLGADAAATYAAILAGVGAIAGDIKRAANRLIVGTTRWTQLMSLVDSDGRPLLATPAAIAENQQGTAEGDAWRFRYFPGLQGIHDPHSEATSCLIGWSGAAASIETARQEVRAVQVGVLGMDIGVWGLFTDALLYAGNVGGLYTITAA